MFNLWFSVFIVLLVFLQKEQDFICPDYDFVWHSGEPGYMNTKTVFTTAWFKFSHEKNFIANFFHAHVEIFQVAVILGVNEFFDIRMIAAQDAHLRAAPRAGASSGGGAAVVIAPHRANRAPSAADSPASE